MTAVYPRKLFYRINEVADIVGVQPYVLRYWETRFPTLKPEKGNGDQRRYRVKDIELLVRIRELLYEEKYTIAGAVERLEAEARGEPMPAPITEQREADARKSSPPADEKPNPVVKARQELADIRQELAKWKEILGGSEA